MKNIQNQQPISNIQWIDSRSLISNEYNPNVVLNQELKLLELSILKTGWIQPILVSRDNVIIDGYHRHFLSKTSKALIQKFDYLAPCCVIDVTEQERMMLTIRINRAKGSHIAYKMHEVVTKLYNDLKVPFEDIQEGIGATKQEIDLLLKQGVFEQKDIKNHKYSKAWKTS